MPVIMGALCLIIALYEFHRTRFFFNPITAMFIMWAAILPFSCWGLYGTVIPSDKVYIIVAIGLAGYLFGAIIGIKKHEFRIRNFTTGVKHSYKFNYLLIYILFGIAIIYYAYEMTIVIGLLASGFDYDYIRRLSIATDFNVLRASPVITITKAFIATPASYLSLALLPMELLKKNKQWLMIAGCIALMGGYLLTTGGRSVLLWFALYFIVIFLLRKSKADIENVRNIIRKYRWWIIFGGIGLLYFLLQMTYSRKGEDVDLLKQIYIYFVCPLQNLDIHVGFVDSSNMYGYGLSSFYGLLYPFMFLLQRLHINVFTPYVVSIYNMSFQDLQMGYDIGGSIYMNAFVTAFYQPYLDGRFIGVLLIMIVFGYVSGRFFQKAYYKGDIKSVLIYILLLQKIIFSYVRFYFTQQAQSICFLLAFFVIMVCKESDTKNIIEF